MVCVCVCAVCVVCVCVVWCELGMCAVCGVSWGCVLCVV